LRGAPGGVGGFRFGPRNALSRTRDVTTTPATKQEHALVALDANPLARIWGARLAEVVVGDCGAGACAPVVHRRGVRRFWCSSQASASKATITSPGPRRYAARQARRAQLTPGSQRLKSRSPRKDTAFADGARISHPSALGRGRTLCDRMRRTRPSRTRSGICEARDPMGDCLSARTV
jgi:hypothetical protein